jgi:hypothetical protein
VPVTAPTFIQEAETAWNVSTSPKNAGPAPVQVGDVLVQVGGAESNSVTAIVPSGGPAWTSQQVAAGGSKAAFASAYAATVAKAEELTVALTRSGGTSAHWGGNVFTFRKSAGIGKSAKDEKEGAPSLTLTTESDSSAIVVVVTDWAAKSGARTWRTVNGYTPTPVEGGNGLERTYFQDGVRYTVYAAYYPDVGAAGAKTVGLSAPTGQNFSIVAVEVKGAKGGTSVTLGQGAEADAAQPLSFTKTIRKSLSPPGESDGAQARLAAKRISLTAALEADAAQSVSRSKHATLVPGAEANAGLALALSKRTALGVGGETDTAQAAATAKRVGLGAAAENDTATAVTALRSVSLATAEENDTAAGVTPLKTIFKVLTPTAELETAVALAAAKRNSLGVALEAAAGNAVIVR